MASYKTLREALERLTCMEGYSINSYIEDSTPEVAKLINHRIVPPDALVALDKAKGAAALHAILKNEYADAYDEGVIESGSCDGVSWTQDALEAYLDRILTACGVHVPDEVVECRLSDVADDDEDSDFHFIRTEAYRMLEYPFDVNDLGKHYTITITRRKEGE